MFAHRSLLPASLKLTVIAILLVQLGCKPAAMPKLPPPRVPAKNPTYQPLGARPPLRQANGNHPGAMYIPPNVVNSTKSNGFQTPATSARPAQRGQSDEWQRESLEAKLLGDMIQGIAEAFQPGAEQFLRPTRPTLQTGRPEFPLWTPEFPPRSSLRPADSEHDRALALILREIEAALAEGRAYAGNRPIVRALRVITENDIQQFADGKSYFVARVKVSHDAVFLPGDLIFAVDGFLMAPGWDVSAILNRRHARTFYRTVDLIRAGRVLKVLPTVTLVFPTEEEIAKRRFQGAIERLLLDELVAQGVITNPAWR